MKVKACYSHLNGEEFLRFRHPTMWNEIHEVIESVDAEKCRVKKSKEKRKQGQLLYSPKAMNADFKKAFESHGWKGRRVRFFASRDEKLTREVMHLPPAEQKKRIEAERLEPLPSYNQSDFVKNRVAVEVQFGKYAFVAHDLFVKHLSFFVSDVIDLGIEILPMKSMERGMSSGVPYYERDLLNVLRQGRGVPAVPLILFGVAP